MVPRCLKLTEAEGQWVTVSVYCIGWLYTIRKGYCHKAINNFVKKAQTRICPSLFKGSPTRSSDHGSDIWPVVITTGGPACCTTLYLFQQEYFLLIVWVLCWNRWVNTGPNSEASSFKTLGWSSSGLKALDGFKPLISLVTPTDEIRPVAGQGSSPETRYPFWSILESYIHSYQIRFKSIKGFATTDTVKI